MVKRKLKSLCKKVALDSNEAKTVQKNIKTVALALPFFVLLTGCLGAQTKPNWINSPPSAPSKIYGVGSAQNNGDMSSTRQKATNNAKKGIIEQLKLSLTSYNETRVNATKKTGEALDKTTNTKMRTFTSANVRQLSGVEVTETFFDDKDKTLYALAVFDKDDFADKQIAKVEPKIKKVKQTLSLDAAYLKRLTNILNARNQLLRLESDFGDAYTMNPFMLREKYDEILGLMAQTDKELNDYRVYLASDDPSCQKLLGQLFQALDIVFSNEGEGASLASTCTFDLTESKRQDGFQAAGSVQIKLSYQDDQVSYQAYNRTVGTDAARAQGLLIEKLAIDISKDIQGLK